MKHKLLFFVFLLVALVIPRSVMAYNFSAVAPSGQTLYYEYLNGSSGNSVSVTGISSPTGALVIPSSVTYNGHTYSVTEIGGYAFSSCSGLTSVTIGNSVTSIGNSAFSHCSGLTSVTIGNSVTSIGGRAFESCTGLTSLNIPDSVTIIGSEAFEDCDHITNITLGKQLSSIGSYAFTGCTQIINITVRSQTPPTIQSNTFDNLNENINLKVPCNSVEAYENAAYWHNCNIEGQFSYLFSVTCDENRGRVRILEQPSCESAEAQIEAIPYHGFHFAGWNDGNTDNPRWIVVTHDTELTAIFADGNEDISNAEYGDRVKVYSQYGVIIVSGAEGLPVSVYNIEGREIVTLNAGNHISVPVPAYGVYLVKVGNHPAKKVVVIR